MEQGLRSNEVFIKKKSSSGCLIIKKKVGPSSGGVGTFPRKGFGSIEEREKRNFGHSVSGSSEDSLEPNCKEILPRDYRSYNGSAMHAEGILGSNRLAQNGEFEGERRKFEGILRNDSFGQHQEFVGERKRKLEGILGNDSFGRNGEFVGERKRKFEGILGNNRFGRNAEFEGERRRKFDDVAFDENVGMYGKRIRKDDIEDRYAVRREFETESGRFGMKECRNSPCFGTSLAIEARLPVSPLRQKFRVSFDKPIRVQGKNGVLKVMINKSKNAHVLRRFYDKYIEDVDRSGSISEIGVNTKSTVGASLYSGLKHREFADSSVKMRKNEPKLQKSLSERATDDLETNGTDLALKPTPTILVNGEKNMYTTHRSYEYQQRDLVRRDPNLEIDIIINAPVTPAFSSDSKISKNGNSLLKPEKSEIKLQSLLSKRAKNDGSETEDGDSSLKREPKGEPVGCSLKRVKIEDKTPPAEKTIVVTCKESKVRRGTGTEKQLLREKIRHKLLTAGWTINYKPRKNRDYLDAVYINPAGTAYWSIIKAYEAFKKQMGEEDVPKELLNKLTRQTKKKMEKEMKIKQRENAIDNDSAKVEAEEDAEDDNNDDKIIFSKKKISKSLKRKAEKPSIDTNSRMIQERTTQKIGRCTLLVRGSDKGSKSQNDDYVPYMGKRTLLSWLIDSGTVNESAEVEYINRKRNKALLKGSIRRNGIHCGCCNKILTVSKFEIHAGSKLQKPFQNIYLENGFSLLQCLIEAWNKQDKAKRCSFYNLNIEDDDENDDACGLCGDGGDLMCCDGCPSTFHQSCIGIQTLPLGDWHCPNCTCKFCERSSAQGNALLTCRLCERKYHKSCKEEIDALSADVDRRDTDFCGKKCQEVFNKLHKLLEVKHELEAGFSWSLIHRTDIDTDMTQHGFPKKVECNSKLAVALSVIEECFLPINDRRSGINLIHNVLYNRGSNYSRLNHSGFYTAILERDDEIIAAASIRIHGTQLAEMPFIGTRHIYRRQGMCRRLLCAIESVGKLIFPAIAEDMHTWIGVFSFNPLKKSHKKEMRFLNMVVFPRTEMLQKMLVEQNTIEKHITADSGAKSILSKEQLRFKPNVNRNSDCDPSFGHDFKCLITTHHQMVLQTFPLS